MILSIRNFLRGPYSYFDEETNTTQQTKEPIREKWLPGDRIDPTTKTVRTRIMADHNGIVGIIDFLNRTGQGFSKRGHPLFMFHPLDPGYPPMIVASTTKWTQNQVATVNIEHWNEKWPRAGIQKLLGPVGNQDIERQACVQMHMKKQPTYEPSVKNLSNHRIYSGTVLHIDPEGCQDIDDVLMWNTWEDGYEFGIGIADVATWIHEDEEIDRFAEQMGQTFYLHGEPILPMLPSSLSTMRASLRSDGILRPVVAYMYTFQNGICIGTRWEQYMVHVQTTFSYESIYNDSEKADMIRNTLQSLWKKPIGNDSHIWIEIAMILYNTAAAVVLKQNGVGILRNQLRGYSSEEWNQLAEKTGCRELAYFGYGSGKYIPSSDTDTRHIGLDIDTYCHASSPLRRYADLYNQRWMKHILFQTEAPKKHVNWNALNERSQRTKQTERNIWFLEHLNAYTITEVEGFLIKEKEKGIWSIYVPVWKRKILGRDVSEMQQHSIGTKVYVRAYTNLNACTLENRIVCSFHIEEESRKKSFDNTG